MLRRCDQVLRHVDIDAAIDAALRLLTAFKRQLLEHGRISRRDFTSYGQNIHRRRFPKKQQHLRRLVLGSGPSRPTKNWTIDAGSARVLPPPQTRSVARGCADLRLTTAGTRQISPCAICRAQSCRVRASPRAPRHDQPPARGNRGR